MSLFNLDRFRYEKRRTSAEQDGRPAAAAQAQEEGSPAAAAQAQEEGSPAAGARAQEEGSPAADGGGNNTAGSSRPGSPASVAAAFLFLRVWEWKNKKDLLLIVLYTLDVLILYNF